MMFKLHFRPQYYMVYSNLQLKTQHFASRGAIYKALTTASFCLSEYYVLSTLMHTKATITIPEVSRLLPLALQK